MLQMAYWLIGLAGAVIGIGLTLFYQAEALMAITPEKREKTSRNAKWAAMGCIVFGIFYLVVGILLLLCPCLNR